jgi:hypothetical protein
MHPHLLYYRKLKNSNINLYPLIKSSLYVVSLRFLVLYDVSQTLTGVQLYFVSFSYKISQKYSALVNYYSGGV